MAYPCSVIPNLGWVGKPVLILSVSARSWVNQLHPFSLVAAFVRGCEPLNSPLPQIGGFILFRVHLLLGGCLRWLRGALSARGVATVSHSRALTPQGLPSHSRSF